MGPEKKGMPRNPALYREMNIGEILIWESSNLRLLIPVVIGLVICSAGFSEGRRSQRDWFLLFGHPRFIDSKPHGEGWPSLFDIRRRSTRRTRWKLRRLCYELHAKRLQSVSHCRLLVRKRRTIHGQPLKNLCEASS